MYHLVEQLHWDAEEAVDLVGRLPRAILRVASRDQGAELSLKDVIRRAARDEYTDFMLGRSKS